MPVQISKADVWEGEIPDRAGGLAEKLEVLAKAGANFQFVLARRQPDRPGSAVVFLSPLKGAAQTKAAQAAGLAKSSAVFLLRVEAPDRPGLGAKLTRAVADAGISMRAFAATALGRQCVANLAFDTEADAKKAGQVLKKALAGK